MTNTTTEAPEASIARAKQAVETNAAMLLKTFSFVPDDKLHWTPSPTSRTPIQIAAHCGGANATFATLLRGEPWPIGKTPEEVIAQMRSVEENPGTREEVVQRLESSAAALVSALENMTPDALETAAWTPFGSFPIAFVMTFPHEHMSGHARQIDYLQTIWGDREDH